MRGVKHNGNCYEANAKYLLYEVKPSQAHRYKVCHGIAINRDDGKPYGHCWLEWKNGDANDFLKLRFVIDKSNGLDITMPLELYYALGGIEKVYEYTVEEVREKLMEFEHWGAWDYDPPR